MRRLAWIVGAIVAAVLLGAVSLGRAGLPNGTPPTELFISEYIEGTSNNKALEIYNGTGVTVNLATGAYNVQMFFNGSATAGLTINLTGSVRSGDVHVLAQAMANATILAQADQTNGSGWFNGDDAVVLRKGTTILDVLGQIGFDPGTEWGTGLTSTADNTLRRMTSINAGDTDGTNAFDPSVQWDGFATDTFGGLGAHAGPAAESAPAIVSMTPSNGATSVANDANLSVSFDEPVDLTSAFDVTCSISGTHSLTVSGGPSVFALDPDENFTPGEQCSFTVDDAGVSDQDLFDPPDTMEADVASVFSTSSVCGDPATSVHAIQGAGITSPLEGQGRTIEGIVVATFQGTGQLGGFYVQEEDAEVDADQQTSEGIFVFSSTTVEVGARVRVAGTVTEFGSDTASLTELTGATVSVCATGNTLPAETDVVLPAASSTYLERYEGMLVTMPQALTATETFTLGRFGEVVLSSGGRLFNPTAIAAPGADAVAQQAANDRNRIVLDDGNGQQNIDPTFHPVGGLSASNTLRSGDTTTDVAGILDQRFDLYRIQPTEPVPFAASNPRPVTPPGLGGGLLTVAALNVLNYFTTLDTAGNPACGQDSFFCRGADSALELERQRAKLVAEITTLDPDVAGLMEIENNAADTALDDLVASLNAATAPGTYAKIATGPVGSDAIKVALIYKPSAVTPTGAYAILDSSVDPRFIDTRNRPAIAQTFTANETGGRFTVVVNHLKSKGSACTPDDPDAFDGQGNCNGTRTAAAEALVDWLATDPTESGDDDVLVIGDLNAYAMEDPISALVEGGYTNLIDAFLGSEAYSFVFQGQSGYLDHALATESLVDQVTGAGEWHVNADEPIVLDYNTEFKSANHVDTLYAPDQYRSSDHDPLAVAIDVRGPTSTFYTGDQVAAVGGSATYRAAVSAEGCDVDGGSVAFTLDENPVTGASVPYTIGTGTVTGGVATLVASATGWQTGVYELTATFGPTALCDLSSDSVVLTVAPAGQSANGGGWLTTASAGRVDIELNIKRENSGGYTGSFSLVNGTAWRLQGSLVDYVRSGSSGAVDGVGTLYRWEEDAWVLVATGVPFNVRLTDNGAGRTPPDRVGLRIAYQATDGPPLPNTEPVPLGGGNIRFG